MPLGGVYTRSDHLAFLAVHLSGPEVADPPLAEAADAGVADPLAAAERQLAARFLAGDEDRLGAVTLGIHLGDAEADRPALSGIGVVPADARLEALHAESVRVGFGLPILIHDVEQLARARREGVAVAPVRAACLVECLGLQAAGVA